MQLLFETSDEFGSTPGLGLLRGRVRRFTDELVVPHVGWNRVEQVRNHFLFDQVADQSHFYFVHSYYCEPEDKNVVAGETEYGVSYASVIAHENICGVQFHPEKSQNAGLQLLKNFARRN
jgi:glutamine amidotransferase